MVEEDRYCTDVLTQISAVTRALQEVALGIKPARGRDAE
jgi:DNA-binding FrmR family transcriptional regulator